MTTLRALLPLCAAPLAACTDTRVVVGGLQEVTTLKAIPNRDLDLLFVVDNSPSMADKQRALAENFPRMMDVLAQVDGGLPNVHIAVTTSDMGTNGGPAIGQVGAGGCSGHGHDGALVLGTGGLASDFIEDIDDGSGGRTRNYTGALRDVFGQLALVGDGGCGFEQHLAAMQRALARPGGFLRPEANLAVVIVADEDDCSASGSVLFGPASPSLGPLQSYRCTRFGLVCDESLDGAGTKSNCRPDPHSSYLSDVQPFVDALIAVKGDPRRVMVAALVGPPEPVAVELRPPPGGGSPELTLSPSCLFTAPDGAQRADPAVRLAAFVDAFPGHAQLASICSADLSSPLATIGGTAKKLVGDPCIETSPLLDARLDDPGIQPACEVVDIRDSAPEAPQTLPACGGGGDCFELVSDATVCPGSSDHLRVRLQRSASVADDAWTHVRCQLAP